MYIAAVARLSQEKKSNLFDEGFHKLVLMYIAAAGVYMDIAMCLHVY